MKYELTLKDDMLQKTIRELNVAKSAGTSTTNARRFREDDDHIQEEEFYGFNPILLEQIIKRLMHPIMDTINEMCKNQEVLQRNFNVLSQRPVATVLCPMHKPWNRPALCHCLPIFAILPEWKSKGFY